MVWRSGRGAAAPLSSLPPARLAGWGPGLTAQHFRAARVVGPRPGHSHEAGLAALQGRVLGLALQRGALHRH